MNTMLPKKERKIKTQRERERERELKKWGEKAGIPSSVQISKVNERKEKPKERHSSGFESKTGSECIGGQTENRKNDCKNR